MFLVCAVAQLASAGEPTVISREESARHYLLGIADQLQGHHLRAAWQFTLAVHFDPTNGRAWFARGELFHRYCLGESAVDNFTRAIRYHPTAEAHAMRAYWYAARGNHAAAITDLTAAIKLGSRDPVTRLNRGTLRQHQGDTDGAMADFDAALEIGPEDRRALQLRAATHFSAGRFERASAGYAELVRLDPNDACAFYNRGTIRAFLKEYGAAIEDLNRALELKPDDQTMLSQRATVHIFREDSAAALRDVNRLMELNPKNIAARWTRGRLLLAAGRHADALADLDRAAVEYSSAECCKYVARLWLDCPDGAVRDVKKAVAQATRAVALAQQPIGLPSGPELPGRVGGAGIDPDAFRLLASSQAAGGDVSAAVATLTDLLRQPFDDVEERQKATELRNLYERIAALRER